MVNWPSFFFFIVMYSNFRIELLKLLSYFFRSIRPESCKTDIRDYKSVTQIFILFYFNLLSIACNKQRNYLQKPNKLDNSDYRTYTQRYLRTILAGYQSRQMPDSGTLGKAWRMSLPNTLVPLLEQDATNSSAIPPEKTWAGDCIICLGDYHEDLPAGMLITSEQEELEKVKDEEDGMEFHSFAREQYQYVDGINGYNRSEQNDQNWVLRNLSKHEYVREEAIKVNSFKRRDNNFPLGEIGLGQVLLSRICWSTDDSCAMRYEEDIHRGCGLATGLISQLLTNLSLWMEKRSGKMSAMRR